MTMKQVCLFFLLWASLPVFSAESLTLSDAWIREAPPSARSLAGYVTLKNVSDKEVVVESMSSPSFGRVMMHDMSMHGGMMHMAHIETLVIQPGESVDFQPGGKHLMLMKPLQAIKAGLTIPITFMLKSGKTLAMDFMVRGKS